MDPWLLMELESLRNRLDRLGEDSDEIQELRDEIESIGNLSLGVGPMQAPLYHSTSKIKSRIEMLEEQVQDQDNPLSSELEDDPQENDEWEDDDELEGDNEFEDGEEEWGEEDDS